MKIPARARIHGIVKNIRLSASLSKRHYISTQHFRAAMHFAAEVERMETDSPPPQTDSVFTAKHRAYVTSAILLSVASLEASINEFYLDCVYSKKSKHALKGLSESHREHLADWWPMLDKRRVDILLKYRHALRIANAVAFETGKSPYQDVDGLIKLRNCLTHYIPEMDNDPKAKHRALRARLKGRFAENPYSEPEPLESLWFPHLCLGSGCANWAVNSTKAFADQFSQAMGIPMRL